MSRLLPIIFTLTVAAAQAQPKWKERSENAEFIHRTVKLLTDIMVHDIYSPPVASRTYAYITIAGYEAACAAHPHYRSLAGQLKGLQPLPAAGDIEISETLSAIEAILAVGRTMVVSESKLDDFHEEILREFRKAAVPEIVIANSAAYGKLIAKEIIQWASADNYRQTRTFSKYAVSNDASSWKPTPPAYLKAVEPHWGKIRPFVIDSAIQFQPEAPPAFSQDSNSRFYKEALAVRNAGINLSDEQKFIANFWDCNPFKINQNGHVMYASKKISPGGHWINIARLACRKVSADPMRSLEIYACLSITIADAFISCWDEKYRSNVIRPETYINQYIDEAWMPLLQTPPFPEYTSGHSVLSYAASVMMTKILGDNFSFTDSTEIEFGIPVRSFTSFTAAAEEAAISRFYGGIHYMPAITNGAEEGSKLGRYISAKLRTKEDTIQASR